MNQNLAQAIKDIDELHSQRFIALDTKGYFLIKVSFESQEIILEHYQNIIDSKGVALNPKTGEPIKCSDTQTYKCCKIYKGRTAKELGMKITELNGSLPLSKLDHALYLGRELQKAEHCLINQVDYIQD